MTTKRNGKAQPDVEVTNHGTIFLFQPLTVAAREWIEENVNERQFFGNALVVEHRFIAELVAGARRDGLEVE